MARPPGRPLVEHVWREDGAWVHAASGEPFDPVRYVAGVKRRQAECQRRRYWDESTGARQRRLARAKAVGGRRRAEQLTLDQVRSDASEKITRLKGTQDDNG